MINALRTYFYLFRKAASSWLDDRAASMGAALAFYSAFSLAPLLIIVISVAGAAFGDAEVRRVVVDQFRTLIGPTGAEAVEGLLEAALNMQSGVIATIIGVFVLLIGATTVLVELQDDLDRIWQAPPRHESGVMAMIRVRILSFGLILGIGFLLLVSLVVGSALAGIRQFWRAAVPVGWWLAILDFTLSIGVFTVLFAMLFKWLPNVKIKWKDVWTGALTTAILFNVGRFAIGLYLGQAATVSAYAAAASFSVLLLWLYYSAQIFLLGAEFTWAHAKYRESLHAANQQGSAAGVANSPTSPGAQSTSAQLAREAAVSGAIRR
jgi:membrane protein